LFQFKKKGVKKKEKKKETIAGRAPARRLSGVQRRPATLARSGAESIWPPAPDRFSFKKKDKLFCPFRIAVALPCVSGVVHLCR
jgi:hypothetical protein